MWSPPLAPSPDPADGCRLPAPVPLLACAAMLLPPVTPSHPPPLTAVGCRAARVAHVAHAGPVTPSLLPSRTIRGAIPAGVTEDSEKAFSWWCWGDEERLGLCFLLVPVMIFIIWPTLFLFFKLAVPNGSSSALARAVKRGEFRRRNRWPPLTHHTPNPRSKKDRELPLEQRARHESGASCAPHFNPLLSPICRPGNGKEFSNNSIKRKWI